MNTLRATLTALALVGASIAPSASPQPLDTTDVEDSNQLAIESALATIDDPGQRERVSEWMEEIAIDAEIINVKVAEYVPVDSGEASSARAVYPSGCGLYVVISKLGSSIENSALTSCTTSFTAVAHRMSIWGLGWAGFNVRVSGWTTYYHGPGFDAANDQTFMCPNLNMANYHAVAEGIMTKGGNEYVTPAVYDTFANDVACGW